MEAFPIDVIEALKAINALVVDSVGKLAFIVTGNFFAILLLVNEEIIVAFCADWDFSFFVAVLAFREVYHLTTFVQEAVVTVAFQAVLSVIGKTEASFYVHLNTVVSVKFYPLFTLNAEKREVFYCFFAELR